MYQADTARYDERMPYRRCGKSGLLLPEISLGFWHNFGDEADPQEAKGMMRLAFDQGITHFDFANNYGVPYGSAERNCGKILKSDFANYRDELIVSTKAGHDMWSGPYGEWNSRKNLLASLDQSLQRLQLDYVDIFYSHRPDPDTPLEETMGALHTAVQQGKALYIGLSKYPLDMLIDAVSLLKEMGTRCLIYQPPLSLLNRDVETQGILEWLEENGIGTIAFSPLAQGMLTDKYLTKIPEISRATESPSLSRDEIDSKRQHIRALHEIAKDAGYSLQHLAIRWVLQRKSICSTIIGARNTAQLHDSISSCKAPPLSEELLQEIDKLTL